MEQQFMTLQELIDEGREEARVEVLTTSILTLLTHKGTVTEELRLKVTEAADFNVLKNWFDLAVESDSVEQFMQRIL